MKNSKRKSPRKSPSKQNIRKSKIRKRGRTSKGKQLKEVLSGTKKSVRIQRTKNNEQIITELRGKGVKLKDIAKSAKISTKTLREYRYYFVGVKGAKEPPKKFIQLLKNIAKKKGVSTKWNLKVFKGEKLGADKIRFPRTKIPKKTKYIHAIMTVKFTSTKGNSWENIISQVYDPSDGIKKIHKWIKEYFNSMSLRPYVASVELLKFDINFIEKWYTEK